MPKKAQEPLPGVRPKDAPKDVPYYSDIPVLADAAELVTMVRNRQDLKTQIAVLEDQVADYSTSISHLLGVAKVDSVGVDHFKVTRAAGRVTLVLTGAALLEAKVDPTRIATAATKVDAQALLGLGVPATTIKRATVETSGEPYLVVTDAAKSGKGQA